MVTTIDYAVPPATAVKVWSSSQGRFSSLVTGVKAPFSHPIYGQDKLHESLIRGLADTPTESQGVKALIWAWSSGQGQFWTVKILDAVAGETTRYIVVTTPCTAYFGKLAVLFGCYLPQQV